MSKELTTNVAFVDDHTLVRAGLVGLVNRLGGYNVVLEADNGLHLKELLTDAHHVHMAIVDLNMPLMDGYATLSWLTKNYPGIRAIALTFDGSEAAVIRAVHAGARGFLLKDTKPDAFKLALDCVRDTGYFENELASPITILQQNKISEHDRLQRIMLDSVTDRELDFIRLACAPEEHTYEAIAELMCVKVTTVQEFRRRVFERFGIKSKPGLVIFAYRWGIVKVQ